jgi:putative flippase GtrA
VERARFLLVGAQCAILHNVIMIGGDWLGFHYVVSTFISFLIVAFVGFMAHAHWTFKTAETSMHAMFRYYVSAAANVPLSLAVMFVLVDLARLPVPLAAPLTTVTLLAWNYVASRWALHVHG